MNTLRGFLVCCATLSLFLRAWVSAFEQCSKDLGGGICPDGNTCCQRYDGKSGCIPSDLGRSNATCCSDDGMTGCPPGYACIVVGDTKGCHVVNQSRYIDPLVQDVPRYLLCDATGIEEIYGFDMGNGSRLAYYSSHGPIETIFTTTSPSTVNESERIDMVLIVIHGANGNADDYFCTAKACVELQDSYRNVLLIAPQFYSASDTRPRKELLFWNTDKDGSWRYGADSMGPIRGISSFSCLDKLVDTLWKNFESLQKVVIAGHSSGAQAVHRWSLLTSEWRTGGMHAVVANPSSFAYLEPLRLVNNTSWQIPKGCPMYDGWEWGLSMGGPSEAPYRDRAMKNTTRLVSRFRDRHVIYLSGSQDRCNVSTDNGWCSSHGLETTCMDEVQGGDRLERSRHYMLSLQRLGFGETKAHIHHIVPGAGHDHAMMFQSPIGVKSLFDGTRTTMIETST